MLPSKTARFQRLPNAVGSSVQHDCNMPYRFRRRLGAQIALSVV